MNKQINPDHCYVADDDIYMLAPTSERDSPEWWVMKNGRHHRTFTSLSAAQGWLEHVIEHPSRIVVGGSVSDAFKAKLAAALARK